LGVSDKLDNAKYTFFFKTDKVKFNKLHSKILYPLNLVILKNSNILRCSKFNFFLLLLIIDFTD